MLCEPKRVGGFVPNLYDATPDHSILKNGLAKSLSQVYLNQSEQLPFNQSKKLPALTKNAGNPNNVFSRPDVVLTSLAPEIGDKEVKPMSTATVGASGRGRAVKVGPPTLPKPNNPSVLSKPNNFNPAPLAITKPNGRAPHLEFSAGPDSYNNSKYPVPGELGIYSSLNP